MSLGWLVSGAYHPAYRKMQPTEAAQIVGTPTNLPLALVIASDAWLAAHARADGHDIAITLADGTTELDYERVTWDNGTGALEIWLKDPAPESGDRYYIYYGDADQAADRQDATGVWSNAFGGVWHLGEASGTIYDSTTNGYDSASENLSAYGATGAVGHCVEFDGTNDYIRFTDILDPGEGDFTALFWGDFDNVVDTKMALNKGNALSGDVGWSVFVESNIVIVRCADGVKKAGQNKVISADTWTQLGFTIDWTAEQILGYLDGSNTNWAAGGGGTGDDTLVDMGAIACEDILRSGEWTDGSSFRLDAHLDEIHIATTLRSANWIATSYNNQKSPAPGGTFWSALGSEEKESRYPAVVFQCPAIV